jgi:2-polyprenyl-3-methyl-5-hydroxy-6-metoxy-1,4-benzoquinol methylase
MNTLQKIIETHDKGFQRRKQWPELFNLDRWRNSPSFKLIKAYCKPEHAIIEIGCLTGHHLLLLAQDGYANLTGIDFCDEAIGWGKQHDTKEQIDWISGVYPWCAEEIDRGQADRIILFDVLEHVHNLHEFFTSIYFDLKQDGEILILVPLGTHYRDEGHVNFYPDMESLSNLLQYYFTIGSMEIVDNHTKIFAVCTKKVD